MTEKQVRLRAEMKSLFCLCTQLNECVFDDSESVGDWGYGVIRIGISCAREILYVVCKQNYYNKGTM